MNMFLCVRNSTVDSALYNVCLVYTIELVISYCLIFCRNLVACMSVVDALLKLNHLLVEPWLPLLWILVPMATESLASQTSSIVEKEVKHVDFMDICMKTYSQLRQVGKKLVFFV